MSILFTTQDCAVALLEPFSDHREMGLGEPVPLHRAHFILEGYFVGQGSDSSHLRQLWVELFGDLDVPGDLHTLSERLMETLADESYGLARLVVFELPQRGVPERSTPLDPPTPPEPEAPVETPVEHEVDVYLVEVPRYFAPGEEIWLGGNPDQTTAGESCRIEYTVTDSDGLITEATLVIARKADPDTPLARFELDEDQRSHGRHIFDWDGAWTEGDGVGQFANILQSPYEIKLKASSSEGSHESKAETAVLLDSLLLERGAYTADGEAPAAGGDDHYQYRLIQLGFHPGQVDGAVGTKTKRAIKMFQRAFAGLRVSGRLDDYTKAYLDEEAPSGTGKDRYQFLLNYLGYRCGVIDGLVGKNTRRAIGRYRALKGIGTGDSLDASVEASLDAEVLPPLTAREVLTGDLDQAEVTGNPLPAEGAEKKVFVDADSSWSPGSLPYNQKYANDSEALCRPHFPVEVRPLIKRSSGSPVFAPQAVGPLRIDFALDTTAPPANLGIPNALARAYVQNVLQQDGDETTTGHHAHENRGGIRKGDDPGVFLTGERLEPYSVTKDGAIHHVSCFEEEGRARGTAGVYFATSTIGGDRFAVTATVSDEGFDAPPSAPITSKTGVMTVWRRYRIAKRWMMQYVSSGHRARTQPQLGLPQWYQPAFIEFVEPDRTPNPVMITPRLADREVIDLPLYTSILREASYSAAQLPAAQIQSRFAGRVLWPLQPAAIYSAADEQGYYDAIDSEIMAFEERFSVTLKELSHLESPEGCTVLVFHDNAPAAGTMGIAAVTNPNLQAWGWSVLASEGAAHLIDDQDTNATAVANGAISGETLAHEVGHALWLHHATTSSGAGATPHAFNQPEHNPAEWSTCTMSYIALPNFCGKCLLKLRGFNEQQV